MPKANRQGGKVLKRKVSVKRPNLSIKKPNLEVRCETNHGGYGDIPAYEIWGTELRIEKWGVEHFRFTQSYSSFQCDISYEVCRIQPVTPLLSKAVPLLSQPLGKLPGKGNTLEFDIDFSKIIPTTTGIIDCSVQLWAKFCKKNETVRAAASTQVKISNRPDDTKFPYPTITRVVGTIDALGNELVKDQMPLAVITRTFSIQGQDLEDQPGISKIQLLKDEKVVWELTPEKEESQSSPSEQTALKVRVPNWVPRGPYQVQVKTFWGVTSRFPLFVGGNRPANAGGWQLLDGSVHENEDWTDECQGMATDGNFWYISSNNSDKKAVYQFSLDMQTIIAIADLCVFSDAHVGAVNYFNKHLYIAIEGPEGVNPRIHVLSTNDIRQAGTTYQLTSPELPHVLHQCAWCAVNPISGDLYTSPSVGPDLLPIYPGPEGFQVNYFSKEGNCFEYKGHIMLGEILPADPEGDGVLLQGGTITSGGKLLVSVYCAPDGPYGIYVYNVFNGEFYGSVPIDITRGTVSEEMEGLAVSPPNSVLVNGSPVNVHLTVLDNDANRGDVYFKHVAVPISELFEL